MHTRNQPRPITITLIILQQQLPRLLIQRRLWVGIDEEAFDGYEDMADPVRRFPVLFEGVDADLTRRTDVGVEYLRCEPTLWRRSRKLVRKLELHSKITPSVRGTLRPFNNPRNIQHILFARLYADTLRRAFLQIIQFTHDAAHDLR